MVNRTYCDTLQEMRALLESLGRLIVGLDRGPGEPAILKTLKDTGAFNMLSSLVEECQVYGNRMEAGLYDKKEYYTLQSKVSTIRKELESLRKEKAKLTGKPEPRGLYE